MSGLQFGGAASGFSFGNTTTTNSFVAKPTATVASFGAAPSSSGGFSFGAGLSTNTSTTSSLQTTPSTGPSIFGTKPNTSATSGFSLGGSTATGTLGSLLSTPATTSAPFQLNLGATTKVSTAFTPSGAGTGGTNTTGFSLSGAGTGFSLAGAAPPSSGSTGFSLSSTGTSGAGTTGFSLPNTGTTSAGFSLSGAGTSSLKRDVSGAATTTTQSGLVIAGTASSSAALTSSTTTTDSTSAQQSLTYRQLEEAINKWTLELEEQEKVFLQQATQVNAWDRLLIENGEKITYLNNDVERVKLDQQRLDHELDFILAQQRELEELLVPLEKAVEQLPSINYQQHADLEREHTYQLAENVDAQLKRMVQDLKGIIEHLNASNSSQDSNDPMHQIAKILNAHMDSLQWIDQYSAVLQRRVEEVTKQADFQRREQERNFRLAYD